MEDLPYSSKLVADIFSALGAKHIFVDVISQGIPKENKVDVSFSVKAKDLTNALSVIEGFKANGGPVQVKPLRSVTKITVEGIGMEKHTGIAGKVFSGFAQNNIRILLISTSETKLAVCVDSQDTALAVNTISQMLNL